MMRAALALLLAVLAMAPVQAQSTRIFSSGTLPVTCTVGNIYLKTGGSAGFYICLTLNTWTGPLSVAGSGGALSALTAATAANTIASGNNHSQVWNWTLTTNTVNALALGETAASSGGTNQNQVLLNLGTLATSTAVPFYIKNYGAGVSLRIDDVAADTTPIIIWEDGSVAIGKATFPVGGDLLDVAGSMSITGGTADYRFENDGTIGTTTNDPLQFFTNNGGLQLILSPSGFSQLKRATAPTSITRANSYLVVGDSEFGANSYRLIGFGYQEAVAVTNSPAYLGYQETSAAGNTRGDLIFLTRAVTTDTAPSERLRIDTQGTVSLPSTSPTPAVSNTSANSCGTTAATIAGNNNLGSVTVGATAGTDCTLTFTTTAPVKWHCSAENTTTPANFVTALGASTTTARLVGTFVAGDVIDYICFAR